MFDLTELYQEIIIDHNRFPRNQFKMDEPSACSKGNNPICGDELTLYLKITDGVISDVSFVGKGCAISTASASLMTEMLKGKSFVEARALFDKFHQLVTEEGVKAEELDKLTAFAGVRNFPSRVKCATLAWHTMLAALDDNSTVVTTE